MPILSKKYLGFDQADVQLMRDMLTQFNDFHQSIGAPEFSYNYVAYLPVFAIALLSSQESIDKLTRILVWLTVVIAVFTIILTVLTLLLLYKTL